MQRTTVLAIVTLALMTGIHTQTARAQFPGIPDPRDILPNPGDIIPGAGDLENAGQTVVAKGYFAVNVKNNSHQEIYVAVSYQDKASGWWVNQGWFRIGRGRVVHLFKTKNAHIYLYAKTADGRTVWTGNFRDFVVPSRAFKYTKAQGGGVIPSDAKYVQFKHVNMGKRFVNFEYSFNR